MLNGKAWNYLVLLGWLGAGCTQQPEIPKTDTPQPITGATAMPTEQPGPAATSPVTVQPSLTTSGIWITLTPESGRPGEMIQIQGYLPGVPAQQSAQKGQNMNQVTVCWQGCLTGLTE